MNASSLRTRSAIACLLLVLGISAAPAADYYVRSDGGSASQCTGLADAPYPGSGSNEACAWSHPFVALPPLGAPRIQGGDSLNIGAGSYSMGYGAPGADNCHESWPWECVMPPIPNGPSPDQPTRILGQGHAAGCEQAPELWGTERAWMVINMEGSSNIELACLEITDHSSCIESHCHNGQCAGEVAACNRDTAPFGPWASTGISARDSSHVLIRDVDIHGLANRGIFAGRISDWIIERTRISANGWIGWDGDIGSDSSNSGTISFIETEIGYNGCAERWPDGEIFGCWAQGGGGYGDGLGVGESGGHWLFQDSTIHHNTSDGIDLLYLNDLGRVTIQRTLVDSNAGNQIKVSRSTLIENSVVIGNCSSFIGEGNMLDGDHCRAAGDAIYVGLSNDSQTDLINNTVVGQGNCVISGGGGSTASQLSLINNLLIGKPYFLDPAKQSCLYYSGSDELLVWESNYIDGVRHGECPGNSLCNGAPDLTDESLSGFDAEPLSSSGLIDSADSSFAPQSDFHNLARDVGDGPDIGAIEWGTVADDGTGDEPDDPHAPPASDFIHDCTNLECAFASSSNDSALDYGWDLGDGTVLSGAVINHAYIVDGSYVVTLTVTDAVGQSSSTSQTVTVLGGSHDNTSIEIDGFGYRVRGRWTTDLTWSGAATNYVDIYRDGERAATMENLGLTTDHTNHRGGGSLEYRLCEAGSNVCSDTLTVHF